MASVTPIRDETTSSTEAGQDDPAPPAKRRRAPVVLVGLLVAAGGAATIFYLTRLGKEKTDDAQVAGHKSNVAPRIAGLPWELLYDRRTNTYPAQSERTPLVRYLEVPGTPRPLAPGLQRYIRDR